MNFGRDIRVLCFTSEDMLQGIRWAFENSVYSDLRFHLEQGKLFNISADMRSGHDAYLLNLDLGQPVPVEHLKKLKGLPGFCLIVQPTPQQLLSIFEVPSLSALEWDGVSFDQVATKIADNIKAQEDRLRVFSFLEQTQSWLNEKQNQAGRIVWVPPESSNRDRQNFRSFILDPSRNLLFGARGSGADIALPIDGNETFADLSFVSGAWVFKSLKPQQTQIQCTGQSSNLCAGDEIRIFDNIFLVQTSETTENLMQLLQHNGLLEAIRINKDPSQLTIVDLIKTIMQGMQTGELRVSSSGKYGSVYFTDGKIEQVLVGPVCGEKALLRILGWSQPTWRFNANVQTEVKITPIFLKLAQFLHLVREWRMRWSKVSHLMPPLNLNLKINPAKFAEYQAWNVPQTQVVAAVVEYALTRDIFNLCPLNDLEVLENLVQLRKSGVIEIARSAAAASQ